MASVPLWIDNSNGQAELRPNHPDGLHEIRIIGEYQRHFIVPIERIKKQVRSQVYIRPFFLRLQNLDGSSPSAGRLRERHTGELGQEYAAVHCELRDRF